MKSLHLSVLAALASLTAPVASQGPVLPYLPQNTIVAVSAPDLAMSLDEFAKMPLAKMWAEEETQNFLADVTEMAKKQLAALIAQGKEMHAQGALPVDPDEILKLRVRGGTFAITQLSMSMGDFGPLPKIGLLLHLDFGDTAAQWHSLAALGLNMLEGAAGAELLKSESKVGEWQVHSYLPNDAKGTEMGLHVAMVPGGLLLGTLLEDVNGIANAMQKKSPVLGASESYSVAAKRLSANGAEFETFVRLDPMVDFAMEALRLGVSMSEDLQMIDMDGVERAAQAMGLRNLGFAAATSTYVDGKAVHREFHTRSGTAVQTGAPPKTIDTSFLKWVPKDAVGFSASTVDVMTLYDTAVKGLQAYDVDVATKVLAQLVEMEKQLGFRVRDDLFGSLGDHYITWSMPMGTISAAPELAILVKVTDEAKLVGALKNMAAMTNGMVEIEEGDKRGVKAYQVRVNFDPTQGMGGMNFLEMFSPTFSFKNGYMVLGFSASDVKRVFQRMDREDDPKGDIRGNKEYAAVASSFPSGLSSLSFTDWKAQFESVYQIATGLLAFVPIGEEIPIDMSLLPDSGTLTKHLFGAVSYSKSDGVSTESVSVSPFGMEVSLLVVALAGAAAGFAGISQRRF